MKLKKSALISLGVIVITVIFLFLFRSIPVTKIWNSYSVIYIQNSVPEETVLSVFRQNNVDSVISLSNQVIPYTNGMIPIIPEENNSYINRRNGFFTDKNSAFRLYYVPQNYEKSAEKAVTQILTQYSVSGGMDGKKQYPYAVPVITLLTGIFFLIFSRNRKAFIPALIFITALTVSNPFYSTAGGAIILLISFFLLQRIWGRKNIIKSALKNKYIIFTFASGILILFLTSVKCALLGIFTCISTVAALILILQFSLYADSKKSFNYVNIFSARQIALVTKKNIYLILMTLIPLFALIISFLLQARFTPTSSTKELYLPSPQQNVYAEKDDLLPNIQDYYKWAWKISTYPYKSLNMEKDDEVYEGEKVIITNYKNNSSGIESNESLVFEYNESFRNQVEKQIEKLPNSSIEKFLKKQKKDVNIIYSQKSTEQGKTDRWTLILILYAILVPIFVTIYYLLNRKIYEKNK